MEFGAQLKELNMTVDEVDRLTKAFKDDKFKEMLCDYARELSDPENKKRYEEEIKLLEEERGNAVEFIHPEPFRALRTSVNGDQKCFINICASEKVGKPESKSGVTEEGRRGLCWSLPHSLHPGRQDTDSKGRKIMIYDVAFHPDTLHIASRNKGFLNMVDSTAIDGIQGAFNVTLDKNNVKVMSTKYKGTPQPCVIRKPIPGYKPEEPLKPDPLAFPYPDDKRATTSSKPKPTGSPATKRDGDTEQKSVHVQPQKTKEPTKPKYTVKYRSFIDLQDFRCSRDSAQSPRPKEIVVTVDMPLLRKVTDASLEVKERGLLLESKRPDYRLELPLAYPVDEDKGEAKFNKQRGQLTVTLPVLPSDEGFDFTGVCSETAVNDEEEGREEVGEVGTWKEKERGDPRSEEEEEEEEEEEKARDTEVKGLKQQIREEEQRSRSTDEVAKHTEEMGQGQETGEDEMITKQKQENKEKVDKLNLQQQRGDTVNQSREDECDRADCCAADIHCDTVSQSVDVSAEENLCMASPEKETSSVLKTAEHPNSTGEEGDSNVNPCLETSDITTETVTTRETLGGVLMVETESSEAVFSTPAESQINVKDSCISQEAEEAEESRSQTPTVDEVSEPNAPGSGRGVAVGSEELTTAPAKQEKGEKTDDKAPPVILREIDAEGNEKIISNHFTSAGFSFQNSLMYELD